MTIYYEHTKGIIHTNKLHVGLYSNYTNNFIIGVETTILSVSLLFHQYESHILDKGYPVLSLRSQNRYITLQ
jgi:hypothetical protein